ncbi:hypothetical protein Tco_1193355, partial [Tanacetum coccineum]
GSHVTNVPAFDKEDFTSWKVRFLVFLDGLEPYLLKTLEDGPFVPLSSLSTSENPLPKCQNQWSHAESRLANQDKRLKTHEGPSDTRYTKIDALRLKFNAFKALDGEKVNGTFTRLKSLLNDLENNGVTIPPAEVNATFVNMTLEEDLRSSDEFIVDLNAEYHERALLANQKRFYKRSGRVGLARKPINKSKETCFTCGKLEDEGITKIRAFMAIAKDEPFVGKADARSALGGKGRRKENIFSKEVIFTKADESSSMLAPEITCDSESERDTQEPLLPLPKLIGAEPASTSINLISLANLTTIMADLTLNTTKSTRTNKISNKVSHAYVIKKKTKTKPSVIPEPCSDKKADTSTEQLLLTLMEEVKGLKEHIKTPSGTSSSNSQSSSSKP